VAVNDDYLIDTLMNMGAVDSAQVDAARPAAEAANAGVVDTLIVQKVLDPDRIVHARAMQFGSEVVDLGDVKVQDDLLKALPRHIARRYQVVPVEYDGSTLTVAMADPSDIDATDGLNRLLDVSAIVFKVASETQIKEAIDKFYGSSDEAVERLVTELSQTQVDIAAGDVDAYAIDDDALGKEQEAPLVKLVNAIITEGFRMG
ncbi:uncharacterized protein METZ01_LOCUS410740, partial [marine metagenome]